MSGNTWIVLGVLALAFSGFAIPYGFYIRGESGTSSSPKSQASAVSIGQSGGVTANTVSIENMTLVADRPTVTQAQNHPGKGEVRSKAYVAGVANKEPLEEMPTAVHNPVPAAPALPEHSPAETFFLNSPLTNLQAALLKASEQNKPVFVVIYDNGHPTHSKITHSLGYFMEYHTTKKLVDGYFITAVVPVDQAGVRKLVPEDDPLENCRLVVLRADGHILFSEGVYPNPDEGMKRVRNVISQWKLGGS